MRIKNLEKIYWAKNPKDVSTYDSHHIPKSICNQTTLSRFARYGTGFHIMKKLVFLPLILFASCSPKQSIQDAGISESTFKSLHISVLSEFFGNQGFNNAPLSTHSHDLMTVEDIQKIFSKSKANLSGIQFVDLRDKNNVIISDFPTEASSAFDNHSRKPNKDEEKAISKISSSNIYYTVYNFQTKKTVSLMAAVRAVDKSCVLCHGVDKGESIGAIIYHFNNTTFAPTDKTN